MAEEFKINQDVFQFITSEEAIYKSEAKVPIFNGYSWSMAAHLKKSSLYLLSQYLTGNSDDKPFDQIIQPILNLHHRSEGFDVKDIILYVSNKDDNHKSLLVKKYHDKWLREHDLDTVIDNSVESYCDLGGCLLKDVGDKTPEVVPLQRLAFCDQTDILSGPICEKHNYSPDQLKEMEDKHWGDENYGATITVDELITLSRAFKNVDPAQQQSKTPGRYVEIYELHGMFPEWWLSDDYKESENKFTRQLHIVAFYQKEGGKKEGICLFKGKEKGCIYELEKRTPDVWGRALGQGGVEELFQPQIWTNYDAIRMKDLLDATSKIVMLTDDQTFAKKNDLKNLDNLSLLGVEEGKKVWQADTVPRSIRLFENAIAGWKNNARIIGAANEAAMGEEPAPGTPFKSVEFQAAQNYSMHEYRQGKLAKFWEKIYRKMIIPQIVADINKGQDFLAELDVDEMQAVADKIAKKQAQKILDEKVLNGESIMEGEREELKEKIKQDFMEGGNKKFIKLIKDELKSASVDIEIVIAGKQKNLGRMADSVTNIFRFIFANPQGFLQIMQMPGMGKAFNDLLEYSGMNGIDFSGAGKIESQMQQLNQMQQPNQTAQMPIQNNK
jgi:hypothetical protein